MPKSNTELLLSRETHCAKCVEFEELFDFLHGIKIRPHQKPSEASCVFCGLALFSSKEVGNYSWEKRKIVLPKSKQDNKFCSGPFKFWIFNFRRSCPNVPHMHRYCASCKGSWIEQTREQNAVSPNQDQDRTGDLHSNLLTG